jgi:L-lactate dehydrogenase complex protein LldG
VEERRKSVNATDNPGRAAILERIRTGLRGPAPDAATTAAPDSAIFDPITNPLERFQQEAKANLMECLMANTTQASAQQLKQVLESLPPGEIFVQDDPSLRRLIDAAESSRPVRWSSQGPPNEASQATISLVEALIAQTGSIFVSASCGGRGASVVAPCHIAVANVAQLVPDLPTALGNATRQGTLDQNSFACVISGSSRTADIEKILVQGAHGPRRLVVILQSH